MVIELPFVDWRGVVLVEVAMYKHPVQGQENAYGFSRIMGHRMKTFERDDLTNSI